MSASHRQVIDPGEPICNAALVHRNPALILNSRQSKTPVGTEEWARRTVDAVRASIDLGQPIIASVGMNTWELILWAVGEYRGRAIVLLPVPSGCSDARAIVETAIDFDIEPESHAWIFIEGDKKSRSGKAWWYARDRMGFGLASRIVPVSVRSGGRLESMLNQIGFGSEIDETFHTAYQPRCLGESSITLPSECPSIPDWNWITHWTCRSNGPWPGERPCDYYRAIYESGDEYPRSAFCTLKRILSENLLRASGNHMRKSTPAVAFTALQPCDALPLMRWRKRYVRPTFEPYGLAIHYRAALRLGIKPVTYRESGEDDSLEESTDPEMIQGYGIGDWPAEKEWRAIGDVDLSQISSDEAIVLVPTEEEADNLQRFTRFRVRALEQLNVEAAVSEH
jgi:hypothetical protein